MVSVLHPTLVDFLIFYFWLRKSIVLIFLSRHFHFQEYAGKAVFFKSDWELRHSLRKKSKYNLELQREANPEKLHLLPVHSLCRLIDIFLVGKATPFLVRCLMY
jgi:hypothetical protein